MELKSDLWSRLPFEIVERVLSFLAVPDLCRYRSVCKRWNGLICNPKFGATHAQNAAKRDASYIVMRYMLRHLPDSKTSQLSKKIHVGWCFLDMAARRWYTVKEPDQEVPRNFLSETVTMDGGLACEHHLLEIDETSDEDSDKDSSEESIIVYNPIAKTVKVLPYAPKHLTSGLRPELNLVVDSISQQFKIFLMNYSIFAEDSDDDTNTPEERLEILNDPLIRIYDSATNKWKRTSTNPSCVSSGVGRVSSVMFQGLLYALLGTESDSGYELWRYSILEDAWEDVSVPISSSFNTTPKLVVSANRLFLVGWIYSELGGAMEWRIEVSEIRIHGTDVEVLFALPYDNVFEVFGIKRDPDTAVRKLAEIRAFGLGTASIMLMSTSSGQCMVYDLVTRSWDRLPPNPAVPHQSWFDFHVGKHMNLILPSTLWWQGQLEDELMMKVH